MYLTAHLIDELIITAEVTALRDKFGHQRLREGKYKPGEIDSSWSDEIRKDFMNWLNNYPGKLPMSKEELVTTGSRCYREGTVILNAVGKGQEHRCRL